MRVLMIGTDRKVFEKGSAVRKRMIEYAASFGELVLIVFAKGALGLEREVIDERLTLIPTNSKNKLSYIGDAVRIGSLAAHPDVISTQDAAETGLAGYLLKRRLGVPLQVQIHTDIFSPVSHSKSRTEHGGAVAFAARLMRACRVRAHRRLPRPPEASRGAHHSSYIC